MRGLKSFFVGAAVVLAFKGCSSVRYNLKESLPKGEVSTCKFEVRLEDLGDYMCSASVLESHGLYEEAVRLLLGALVRFGERKELLLKLAHVLKQAGLEEEALLYLKRAHKGARN